MGCDQSGRGVNDDGSVMRCCCSVKVMDHACNQGHSSTKRKLCSLSNVNILLLYLIVLAGLLDRMLAMVRHAIFRLGSTWLGRVLKGSDCHLVIHLARGLIV